MHFKHAFLLVAQAHGATAGKIVTHHERLATRRKLVILPGFLQHSKRAVANLADEGTYLDIPAIKQLAQVIDLNTSQDQLAIFSCQDRG